MKYLRIVTCVLLGLPLSISTAAQGQSWSNILSQKRAINWSRAGLPATLPDGETTANPWTPPARTVQCGSTLVPSGSAATDTSNINAAVAACAAGDFVLLGAGTFQIDGEISLASNVSLRGSDPQSTILALTGSAVINYGNCCYTLGYGALSASQSAGAASVTITSTTGTPTVGNMAWFNQCDSGWSGTLNNGSGANSCTVGAPSDNGAIYVCAIDSACNIKTGETTPPANGQTQVVQITSVVNNGSGSFTVGFSPGLYMPNWSTSNTAALYWQAASASVTGAGLEDMTVEFSFEASENISMNDAYDSWIKGVRIVGAGVDQDVYIGNHTAHSLVANNYFYGQNPPSQYTVGSQIIINNFDDSDDLILNNICQGGDCTEGQGSDEGDVYAYNYSRDVQNNYNQATSFQHDGGNSGAAFNLQEGNEFNSILDDNTWGTHDFDTWFRNHLACWDPPFQISASTTVGISIDSYARFDNAVGNGIGTTGTSYCGSYQSTSSVDDLAFGFDSGNTDGVNFTTSMRWGNYDTADSAVHWCGNSSSPGWSTTCSSASEVPTTLSGNAAPYENPIPATTALPCSFFLPGYTSTTCTPHASGGTGLSWWKVVKSWTTFPTAPATTQLQPFPPTGPDVTGGPYLGGYAYDVPAEVAWQNLPVDSTFQGSYAITGSSWASGIETLTVSGLPTGTVHIMGSFQLSGVASACTSGAAFNANNEILMTGSTATTITYALASNPGVSCTGSLLFPDVRQFDERVYEADPSTRAGLGSPVGLTGSVVTNP